MRLVTISPFEYPTIFTFMVSGNQDLFWGFAARTLSVRYFSAITMNTDHHVRYLEQEGMLTCFGLSSHLPFSNIEVSMVAQKPKKEVRFKIVFDRNRSR